MYLGHKPVEVRRRNEEWSEEKMKCDVDLGKPWSNPQRTVWNIYSLSKFSCGPKWLRIYPPTVIRMGMAALETVSLG